MEKLNHKEGISFSGPPFWIGLSLLGCSTYVFFNGTSPLTYLLASILVIAGALALLSIRGIEFEFKKRSAVRYFNFILFKINFEKIDLASFEGIELKLYADNQSMNMLSISTTVRTREYELYLYKGSQKTLIAESTDYTYAKKLMNTLAEGLNIPSKDLYAEWRTRLKSKNRK